MKGRIVIDPLIYDRQVYLPSCTEDLSEALKKILNSGLKPVVLQTSVANTAGITTAATDVHVDLSQLNSISVSGTTVTVGPATTIRSFVDFLKRQSLFLPLSQRSDDTVLDAVEDASPGVFDRSVATLRSTIATITAVASASGQIFKIDPRSVADKFNSAVDPKDTSHIITAISFNAIPAANLPDLWLAHVPFLLSSPELPKILTHLSKGGGDIAKYAKVDFSVTTLGALSYALPIAYITVAARDADHKVPQVLAALLPDVATKEQGKGVKRGALAALSAVSYFHDPGARTMTRHVWLGEKQVSSSKGDTLAPLATRKVANKSGSSSNRVQVSLRVARAHGSKGGVYLTALLMLPTARLRPEEVAFEKKVKEFFGDSGMKRVTRKEDVMPTVSLGSKNPPFIPSVPVHKVLGAANMVGSLDTTQYEPIPGFTGPMYMPGDPEYEDSAKVYASSSYPEEHSQPYVVAYPQSITDIRLAIAYAKMLDKKVVARSGGHQYSCLSSGGSSVVILSMDRFSYAVPDENDPELLKVGAGSRLTRVSEYMTQQGVVVPHGECPRVAVGGHTQSGGYGHTLRFMGLLVDYVKSFRIVLADSSYVSVYRPNVEPPSGKTKVIDNDDIFYGVLGGGPGSFGVVVDYSYESFKDIDHPYSSGFSSITWYTKRCFSRLFDTIQQYTIDGMNGVLDDDIDIMCTAMSFDWKNFFGVVPDRGPELGSPPDTPTDNTTGASATGSSVSTSATATPNITTQDGGDDGSRLSIIPDGYILIEQLYGNRSAQPDTTNPSVADRFQAVHDSMFGIIPTLHYVEFDAKSHTTLSSMCDGWVRNFGMTSDGREFEYPYKKRVNATFEPLTDDFKNGFVDLVSDAIADDRVRVVFQMVLGGSQHRDHPNRQYTAVQRRDVTIGVVFDIFYTEGNEALAETYQAGMTALLKNSVPEKDTVKMIWGSFGNTNINEVWQEYYDNRAVYGRLQDIKQKVDPDNVFSTEFTVQPPTKNGGCTIA